MKRIITISLVLLALAGGGFFAWKWFFGKQNTIDAFKLVPTDAVFVVETDEPVEGWKTFAHSAIWEHIKNYKPLGDIGKMADGLSQTIEDNDMIFSAFGSRNVMISCHVTGNNDYDFLYVCDMKQSAKFKTIQDGIIELLKQNGYQYGSIKINENEVHTFKDKKDNSVLHLSFIENQLVCSYNQSIIEKSLHQSTQTPFTDLKGFSDVASGSATGGLCKIYLNHKFLPGYLNVFMGDVSDMKNLFGSMTFTAANAEMNDKSIEFSGLTGIDDSVGSHLRALLKSGKSKTGAHQVLSEKTAFMMSMGFQSFNKFYANLTEVYKEDEVKWKEFNSRKKTIEKLLRFKLEEDLLGWIDDEVTLAQYDQDRVIGGKLHTLAAFRAVSIDKAKEKLGKLEKRLKLVGKFKSEKYKEYDIHYMEIRGLFKLLFGKLFDKIEKPYYTFIDNYVIFCDDAKSLLETMDDYTAEKTLSKDPKFSDFHSKFDNENTLFAYVNMKKYFLNLKGILDAESYQKTYNNRQYTICFRQMGFQLSEENEMFDTRMMVDFEKPNEYDMEITEGKVLNVEELEELDSMSDADAFLLQYIHNSVQREYYENGQLKFSAETKEGVLNGRYIEYYENGNIKTKGRYRDGQQKGKWYYYKEDGTLDRKERFGRKSEDPVPEEAEVAF